MRSKRQLLKLAEKTSAKHSCLPPHYPREPFSRSTRANVGKMHYIERGPLFREGLSTVVLSVLIHDLALQLRRSVDLTVVPAMLS